MVGESRGEAPLHLRPSQYGLPSMGMLKRGVEVQEGQKEGGTGKERSSPALSDIF